jgi:hypothetical protein
MAAAAIQANAIPPEVPAPVDQVGQLNYKKVTDLRSFYLDKQKLIEGPTKALTFLVGIVITVAVVVLANIATFLGGFGVGLAVMATTAGLLTPRLVNRLDQTNKQAADAIISPGFYEFAIANPRQLANADQINAAFARFLAAPPPEGR